MEMARRKSEEPGEKTLLIFEQLTQ